MKLVLVNKEINRMKEFGRISENPSDTDKLVKEIITTYGLNLINEGDLENV